MGFDSDLYTKFVFYENPILKLSLNGIDPVSVKKTISGLPRILITTPMVKKRVQKHFNCYENDVGIPL
jgi:hypothetical protein